MTSPVLPGSWRVSASSHSFADSLRTGRMRLISLRHPTSCTSTRSVRHAGAPKRRWSGSLGRSRTRAGVVSPTRNSSPSSDPTVSPIAAFALAYAGIDLTGPLLLNTYFYFERGAPAQRPDGELLWAITEVFGKQDANWLCDQVIMRWLKHHNLALDGRLCYLIQKLGQAPPDSCIFKYLEFCLQQEQLSEHDRALRAFSNLKDPTINAWLIPLCQDTVSGNWDGVRQSETSVCKTSPLKRTRDACSKLHSKSCATSVTRTHSILFVMRAWAWTP